MGTSRWTARRRRFELAISGLKCAEVGESARVGAAARRVARGIAHGGGWLAGLSSEVLEPILSRIRSRSPNGRDPSEFLVGPIRGQLLGAEHLAERARSTAAAQRIR